ncbi:MAG: helix-turn-helix transcriptional regulator [Lachnospiraceae bacterium]|nr:helix-turn-helix transcriptional regulator [Lachnospiraceae bacterium]
MNRLRKLREEKAMSQEELAFELGISQQRVSNLERSRSPLSEELILQSVQYFGVTSDYLLGLSSMRLEFSLEELPLERVNQSRLRELLYYFSLLDEPGQELLLNLLEYFAPLHKAAEKDK